MITDDAFKIKLWATNRIKELELQAEDTKYSNDVEGIICVGKVEVLEELIKYINDGLM